MAAPLAEVGRGTLYVFVEAGRGNHPACFSNLCSPQDTIRSLCEAIERQSRDAGVLKSKVCIRNLKLVFQNNPEVLLSNDDLLEIVFTILDEHSGKGWRQTLASGVWPRITAVVRRKKRRSQAAPAREEGPGEEVVATPVREEGETTRKRRAEGFADQEGTPQKTQKRAAGDAARSQGPSVLSATPDQAGPSGSAPGPSSDRMPTAWLSKLSIVRQLQREESARELEERGAAPEKGAQLTGVSQKGKEATGARRETSTEMGQRGSEASGATARSDMQVGGADRSAAQGVDEGRLTSRGVDLERGGEKGGLPNGAKRIRKQAKGAETRAQSEVQRLKAEERELIGRRGRSAKGVKKPEGASRKEKPDGGGARQAGSPGEPVDGGPNSNRRVSTNFPVSDSEDEAGARLPERPPAVRVETALEEAGGPQAPGSSSGGSLEGASGSSDGRAAVEKPLEGKRSLKKAPHGTGGKGVGGAAGGRSKQSAGQGSKKPAQTSEAVCCDVCDESDNPELVVVCAGDCCQKVRHIYCHSEDLEEVPEGNWFCSVGCETREGEKTGGPWELVGQPICSEPGCSKKAYWGYKGAGSLEKERCRKHKESDMVSNRVRTCEVLGCDTRPSYMPPGSKRRERCAKHKEQGMRHEHACSEPGCDIVAGWRCTITKTRRCSSHKLSGMRPRKRGKKDGPVQRIPS